MNRITKISIAAIIAANTMSVPAQAQGGPPPPVARFADEPLAQPFELYRGERVILKGTVNGFATDMLLDSGSGMTIIDQAFADRIGLKGSQSISVKGVGGTVQAQLGTGVRLATGALQLSDLYVLIMDMSSVARGIGRPIPVVLGREAFKAAAVTIDFPKQMIRFANRATFLPLEGATKFDLSEKDMDMMPTLTVSVAGLPPIEAGMDLGNGRVIELSQSYWTSQPLLRALRNAEGQGGGVGGTNAERYSILPEVKLGSARFVDVPAVLTDDPKSQPTSGAHIGIRMLKPFLVSMDWTGHQLYLKQVILSPRFERERAGVRLELTTDRLTVAFVSPQGPAAAAGLKAGDEIVAIDGQAVTRAYYSADDWTRGEAGRHVELTRADGTKVTMTLADYY